MKQTSSGIRASNSSWPHSAPTVRSAEAANQLALKSYIADQRAWIQVTVEPGTLKFDEKGLWTDVKIGVKNLGKTPAIHIEAYCELRAPNFDDDDIFYVRMEFDKLALRVREQHKSGTMQLGRTLFPDESTVVPLTVFTHHHFVDRATLDSKEIRLSALCIVKYRTLQDDDAHMTGKIYRYKRRSIHRDDDLKSDRTPTAIYVDLGLIPEYEIFLTHDVLSTNLVD